jgi:hypothetical protein
MARHQAALQAAEQEVVAAEAGHERASPGGPRRPRLHPIQAHPLLVTTSILLGLFSIWQTPREEEPQVVVPVLDVFVQVLGLSAQEVEQRLTAPMDKLLRELGGRD